ncbi:MAG: hypothetical protein AABY16_04145 [Nanoarchaeota archaeon]
MSGTIQIPANEILRKYIDSQTCVLAIRRAELPPILKAEVEQFIERNVLPDCGRVPPNCLKAFMVWTAQKMGLTRLVPYIKGLFKSDVGFKGYFLDSGKLFHVNALNNQRQLP